MVFPTGVNKHHGVAGEVLRKEGGWRRSIQEGSSFGISARQTDSW
jgi:hypothetical protein